ncbi:hypothetical protein FGO68_gene15183 [Halteria grandinella]|uniref:Uncharacterized protein n=1 Tax=Halteria grandinella TaxID=5974 RepID=A0A8J8T5T3_HALGN|nr:hypothetical protein FGO68_gene15183 [Halteria grandinella]
MYYRKKNLNQRDLSTALLTLKQSAVPNSTEEQARIMIDPAKQTHCKKAAAQTALGKILLEECFMNQYISELSKQQTNSRIKPQKACNITLHVLATDLNGCLSKKGLKLRKRLSPDETLQRRLNRNHFGLSQQDEPYMLRNITKRKVSFQRDEIVPVECKEKSQTPPNNQPDFSDTTFGTACVAVKEVTLQHAVDNSPKPLRLAKLTRAPLGNHTLMKAQSQMNVIPIPSNKEENCSQTLLPDASKCFEVTKRDLKEHVKFGLLNLVTRIQHDRHYINYEANITVDNNRDLKNGADNIAKSQPGVSKRKEAQRTNLQTRSKNLRDQQIQQNISCLQFTKRPSLFCEMAQIIEEEEQSEINKNSHQIKSKQFELTVPEKVSRLKSKLISQAKQEEKQLSDRLTHISQEILEESSDEDDSKGQFEGKNFDKENTKFAENHTHLFEQSGRKNRQVQRKSSEEKKPPRLSHSNTLQKLKAKSRSARDLTRRLDSILPSDSTMLNVKERPIQQAGCNRGTNLSFHQKQSPRQRTSSLESPLKHSYLGPRARRGCELEVIFEPSFAGQSESLLCPSVSENEASRFGLDEAFILDCSRPESTSQNNSSKIVGGSTDYTRQNSKQSDQVNETVVDVKVMDQDLSFRRQDLIQRVITSEQNVSSASVIKEDLFGAIILKDPPKVPIKHVKLKPEDVAARRRISLQTTTTAATSIFRGLSQSNLKYLDDHIDSNLQRLKERCQKGGPAKKPKNGGVDEYFKFE